tara:strand:- start:833 stop:1492 length:660 start_codon:yes stop_codon:yes gene_type:complete
MALPTSGALSLDAIHVEAGGTTNTTASLNDTDIRGLTAGAGKTINSTPSTTIDFDDFYGASSVSSFSTTCTVGQGNVDFTSFGFHYRYRGFAVDSSLGNGPWGSLSSRSNSSFLNGEDIDFLLTIAAVVPTSPPPFGGEEGRMLIRLGNGSSAGNTDSSFATMTVNGTQFNRSDAAYTASNGQWTWDYHISSVPNDATSAIPPFPAVGQTCTITFTGGT